MAIVVHFLTYHAMADRVVDRVCSRVGNGLMPSVKVKIFQTSGFRVWFTVACAHSNSCGYGHAWLHIYRHSSLADKLFPQPLRCKGIPQHCLQTPF